MALSMGNSAYDRYKWSVFFWCPNFWPFYLGPWGTVQNTSSSWQPSSIWRWDTTHVSVFCLFFRCHRNITWIWINHDKSELWNHIWNLKTTPNSTSSSKGGTWTSWTSRKSGSGHERIPEGRDCLYLLWYHHESSSRGVGWLLQLEHSETLWALPGGAF